MNLQKTVPEFQKPLAWFVVLDSCPFKWNLHFICDSVLVCNISVVIRLILSSLCNFQDVRVSSVNNRHDSNTEVFTTGTAKIDVVTIVVVDNSLGQHGVILNL